MISPMNLPHENFVKFYENINKVSFKKSLTSVIWTIKKWKHVRKAVHIQTVENKIFLSVRIKGYAMLFPTS